MITKSLAVLNEYKDAMKQRGMSEYYTRIDEAILELEELQSIDCEIIKVITGKPYNGGIIGIMANMFNLKEKETYEVTIREIDKKRKRENVFKSY
jgi:hypothetical protein